MTCDLKSEKELATVRQRTKRKNVPAERKTLTKAQEEKKKARCFQRTWSLIQLDHDRPMFWGKLGKGLSRNQRAEHAGVSRLF